MAVRGRETTPKSTASWLAPTMPPARASCLRAELASFCLTQDKKTCVTNATTRRCHGVVPAARLAFQETSVIACSPTFNEFREQNQRLPWPAASAWATSPVARRPGAENVRVPLLERVYEFMGLANILRRLVAGFGYLRS